MEVLADSALRSLFGFQSGSALGAHRVFFTPFQGLDEFHAPETGPRPVFIDGHSPHAFKAQFPEYAPPPVAADFALIPL